MPWAGKTVLFSGRIPIRVKEETWKELVPEISKSRDDAADYLIAVNRLAAPRPDLWLPAVATDGRNANLYDTDWEDLIAENYRAGHTALNSPRWTTAPSEITPRAGRSLLTAPKVAGIMCESGRAIDAQAGPGHCHRTFLRRRGSGREFSLSFRPVTRTVRPFIVLRASPQDPKNGNKRSSGPRRRRPPAKNSQTIFLDPDKIEDGGFGVASEYTGSIKDHRSLGELREAILARGRVGLAVARPRATSPSLAPKLRATSWHTRGSSFINAA